MNEFYNEVMLHDKIYSLLYSPQRTNAPIESQIIDIKTSELDWAKDKEGFFYVWGYPGPDYNYYTMQTYGKGWAFTEEEIVQAWVKG